MTPFFTVVWLGIKQFLKCNRSIVAWKEEEKRKNNVKIALPIFREYQMNTEVREWEEGEKIQKNMVFVLKCFFALIDSFERQNMDSKILKIPRWDHPVHDSWIYPRFRDFWVLDTKHVSKVWFLYDASHRAKTCFCSVWSRQLRG